MTERILCLYSIEKEDKMNPVDYFKFELDQIKHTSIRDLVIRVFNEKVPKYFMEVEASSSGLYHMTENGEPIKLRDHVKAAVRFFLIFMKNPLIRMQFTDMEKDYIISALLLHDCTKRGVGPEPTNNSVFEHPITSALLLPDNCNAVEYQHFSEICRLITTHHGPWRFSSYSSTQLPEVKDNCQFYVHLCDYLASRSVIWVDTRDDDKVTRMFIE